MMFYRAKYLNRKHFEKLSLTQIRRDLLGGPALPVAFIWDLSNHNQAAKQEISSVVKCEPVCI